MIPLSMAAWIDMVLGLLVLTNLALLGSGRIRAAIRIVAIQGVALGLLPLFVEEHGITWRAAGLALGSGLLKGVVFPVLLTRARRVANVRREATPLVGFTTSLLAGAVFFGVALWLGGRLPLPQPVQSAALVVPAALFTIFSGLFLIVTRRIALNQVLGYLVLENGVYAFGVALAMREPLLVELGVLLDVFVAVFVMGIAMFHITRAFDSIDTDRMQALTDWTPGEEAGDR